MSSYEPLNFMKWINEHRDLLKPPVGNKQIWVDREFIVMVVGGPNERTDYHYNEGEEFFYQIEGDMVLKVVDNKGIFRDINIHEGEIYLLPPKTPHSPQRKDKSIGLVIERKRKDSEKDGLMWFCQNCNHKLYSEYFQLVDIEKQFDAVFDNYYESEHTTCKKCQTTHSRD